MQVHCTVSYHDMRFDEYIGNRLDQVSVQLMCMRNGTEPYGVGARAVGGAMSVARF